MTPIVWKSTLLSDDKQARKVLLRGFPQKCLDGVECMYLIEKAEVGGTLVNLGCFRGTSASLLAWGLRHYEKAGHVYTVDVYETRPDVTSSARRNSTTGAYENAKAQIAKHGLEDRVTQCVGTTVEWASKLDEELSFVFIDADHSYEGCKADFEAWAPKVRVGGLISFHDSHSPPVQKVIEEAIAEGYVEVPGCFSIRTLEKVNLG